MIDDNIVVSTRDYVEKCKEIFKKFSGDRMINSIFNEGESSNIKCKLFLEGVDGGELLWGLVNKIEPLPDGFLITAIIINAPQIATQYRSGDTIKFHSEKLVNFLIDDCPFLPLRITKEFQAYIKTVEFTVKAMWELSETEESYDFNADLVHYYDNCIEKEKVLNYAHFTLLCDNIIKELKTKN